ncbi:ATP synthase subunit delta, mitochondrial [Cydia fagiglandana]|uniref:ATP synthase subunit delta, mitochondrial n=1 Tax=Cydia fagiglandana TaxID=1458189 RepID=UPI00213D4EF9
MSVALRGLLRGAARRVQVRTFAAEAPKETVKEGEMALTFAAGNKVFYNKVSVKQVDVPSFSGSFGILAKHVPTLAVLRPGVVTVVESDGKQNKIFVSSGTITVNDDSSVQVLAEEAHPLESLDRGAAQEALSKAQSELSSASGDKAKAEAAIAVEVAEEIVKAASA